MADPSNKDKPAPKLYKRQCANWLATFGEWVLPLAAEAPEPYIFWSGLFALSSVLRRRVLIPQKYLGRWECPPHLYIMFVGPPGTRKTTSARSAAELLEAVGSITQASDTGSVAAFSTELINTDDCSLFFIVEEFSDLIGKSHGKEMYEFLTSMFDGKKRFKINTISRGAEFATNPCLNMLAATTPIWIASNMTEDIIGGGFASRVIFIYEDTMREKRLFYDDVFDEKTYNSLKTKLIDDLKHIATLTGKFSFQPDAREFLDKWYKSLPAEKNPKLLGFAQRKPAHILKLAMLWHIAYSDDLEINIEDCRRAVEILSSIEKKLPKVFEGIGKNPYVFNNREIYNFLLQNGPTERSELLRQFEAIESPYKMDEVLNGLLELKMIKGTSKDGKVYYEAVIYAS